VPLTLIVPEKRRVFVHQIAAARGVSQRLLLFYFYRVL